MTPAEQRTHRFIAAGKILAGDEPGWAARLARRLDMNRGYVAAIVAGTRPVNIDAEVRLAEAIDVWWQEVRDNAQLIMRIKIELDTELGTGKSGKDGGRDA